MYEVLALSMEIDGRPREEVNRVVMSLADFGTADFGAMTYSAAYLVRLGREAAGLRLYREASRILPEQPEPYVLGLKLARKLQDVDGIEWAAAGVLQYAWYDDYKALHREAENAVAEVVQRLRKNGVPQRAEQLEHAVSEARRRDLIVRLVWSGEGDLDLLIEEPSRSVCSFEQPETPGGGRLVHDGYGPEPERCYEEYVCALAQSGDYRIRVRHAWGNIVGGRAVLTVIQHQGLPSETVHTHSIVLGPDEPIVRVQVADGRRKTLRAVAAPASSEAPRLPAAARGIPLPAKVRQAAAEFAESRELSERFHIRRTGAVAFQPIIQIVPDGATFTAQAVVSPDRRYVRIGVNPVFNNLTDVFTFTFFGGASTGQTGAAVGN